MWQMKKKISRWAQKTNQYIYTIHGKDSQKFIGKPALKAIVKSLILAFIPDGQILEDYVKWLIQKLKLRTMEDSFMVRDVCKSQKSMDSNT